MATLAACWEKLLKEIIKKIWKRKSLGIDIWNVTHDPLQTVDNNGGLVLHINLCLLQMT